MVLVMLTWVFESGVFSQDEAFVHAVKSLGHQLVLWSDDWWQSDAFPNLRGPVLFRGSLGNAARLAAVSRWSPGVLCDVDVFSCASYYPQVAPWRLAEQYEVTTVELFCQRAKWFAQHFESTQLFVRPDSPLKPFSGRIVDTATVIPETLDYGFYYTDLSLPIVVSAVQESLTEWRFVIVDGGVVAHSGYDMNRASTHQVIPPPVIALAETVAQHIQVSDFAYILDLCQTNMGYRVVELNPFSGADLYGCDVARVVKAVADVIQDGLSLPRG